MQTTLITGMGATGHTGKQITEALLKAGEKTVAQLERMKKTTNPGNVGQ